MTLFFDRAQALADQTISIRRTLHQSPELGFKEFKTSALVADYLEGFGVKIKQRLAETGLLAQIPGNTLRPTGMLRFDMDALPIQEETGLDFASNTPGVMHACGHDGHMAIGITVARMLQEYRENLQGSLSCIFQPAEEGDGGARRMIQEGVLSDPKPDFILGLHLWNEIPLGTVVIRQGPLMAGSDTIEIAVKGKGGHGGLPQQVIDPIVCAAQMITALQSIVSRNLSPFDNAVLSLTSIHGGTAFNVMPDEVRLKGTLRTFENQVRARVLDRMREIINGIASAMGCEARLVITEVTPAVINDPRVTAMVNETAESNHPSLTIDDTYQTTVSEDFAYYQQEVPGCFILFGSANAARGKVYSHHHPRFDFDEAALPLAASLLADCSASLLRDLSN